MSARRTIAREIEAQGTALHSGVAVRMVLSPGKPGIGIVFRRSDLADAQIPARYDAVTETNLGTMIASGEAKARVSVGVVEHLMAAIAGAQIDDLLVTLDGPEPPILDGDALCYLDLLNRAGFREQGAARQAFKVLQPVSVSYKSARASLFPAESLSYDFEIDFPAPIGRQVYFFPFSSQGFAREIAPARTFGFVQELDSLKKMDRGHGASLANTLAIDGGRVVNAALMRFDDEFVRHKILDAIGDLALAGLPIIGRFEGIRSGHALNNALLKALFADPTNYALVEPS